MTSPMYLSTWVVSTWRALLSPENTLSDSYCSFFKFRSDSYQVRLCQNKDSKKLKLFNYMSPYLQTLLFIIQVFTPLPILIDTQNFPCLDGNSKQFSLKFYICTNLRNTEELPSLISWVEFDTILGVPTQTGSSTK